MFFFLVLLWLLFEVCNMVDIIMGMMVMVNLLDGKVFGVVMELVMMLLLLMLMMMMLVDLIHFGCRFVAMCDFCYHSIITHWIYV